MLICLFVLKWKAFSCRDRHTPPPISRAQRISAQAQHTACPRQVLSNEWTLYMAAIIDPQSWWTGRPSWVVALYRKPLQAGSTVSPQIPSESNVHAIFETPWIFQFLHACWMCPYRAHYELRAFIYLFVVGQIFGVCIFWGIWVWRDPTFPAKTKNKTIVKGSAGAHWTRWENSGSISRNGVSVWTFVRKSAKITASNSDYLVSI